MKTLINIVSVIAVLALAAGCTQAVRRPETIEQTTTTRGVFTEVAGGGIEPGKVDLIIRLSLKTHTANYYLLESKKSLHGKPGYPFVATIDGQSVVWRSDGEVERTPTCDAKGIRSPEGGDGVRYILEKRVRLAPGLHQIEMDLPEERYSRGVDVMLGERESAYELDFRPIYKRSSRHRATFVRGLAALEPFLDGKAVSTSE